MAERRVNYIHSLQDAYVEYKKLTKNDVKNRLSEAKFKEVFITFLDTFLFECFDAGQPARLPYNLGTLYIKKSKKKFVNISESIKQKKKVYYNNDHTGGYYYKIMVRAKTLKYAWAYKGISLPKLSEKLYKRILDFADRGKYYPTFVKED